MSNLESIRKLPSILEVKEISIEDVISAFAEEKAKTAAIENAKDLFAYKITYTSQDHKVIGYIVEPRTDDKLPCVVFNRGGSYEFGALKDEKMFAGKIARIARSGYMVIASQYSGNAGGEGVDHFGGEDIHDVLNLYEILKGYDRADISRIGMVGGSRGGMMTLLALKSANWIKAAVVEYAITDLFDTDGHRPDFQDHLKKMFGGSDDEKRKRSAIYWVDKLPKTVPVLILQGTSDWRVNPMDAIRLAEKLLRFKVPYRLIMYEGGTHGLPEFRKGATDETIKWLDKYVKDKIPLPNLEFHGE